MSGNTRKLGLAGRFVLLAAFLCLLAMQASPRDCARCHPRETADFSNSGMAQALRHAAGEPLLSAGSDWRARAGEYSYQISHSAEGGPVYSVSDGTETLRFPLEWAVGKGVSGQTYLFQHEGGWYETRVSYFSLLKGFALTIGAQNSTPHSLLEAAGRALLPGEATKCLDCHATNAATQAMEPGIQCERCHGSSEAHLGDARPMRKLGKLTTEEQSNFCGQCHRTWADIAANGPQTMQNVRFQPYRLTNSKCYDTEDARIRCTACHDPHRDVVTKTATYDAKCLACHSAGAKPATKAAKHVCKVGVRDCAGCHMPRIEVPGTHTTFTDHWIRTARANEPYPN